MRMTGEGISSREYSLSSYQRHLNGPRCVDSLDEEVGGDVEEGRKQKAESRRQKAEGKRQKAKSMKAATTDARPGGHEHPASQRPTESPSEFSSNTEKQKAEFQERFIGQNRSMA